MTWFEKKMWLAIEADWLMPDFVKQTFANEWEYRPWRSIAILGLWKGAEMVVVIFVTMTVLRGVSQ